MTLATLIAQGMDLLTGSGGQISIQAVGVGGVVWVLKKLAAIDRRLIRIECAMKISDTKEGEETL